MSAAHTGKGDLVEGQHAPPDVAVVRHLARHQVMGLASLFLLGMAVNLLGLPSQTSGAAHLASIAFLAAHALIALGLLVGTTMLLRAATGLGGRWRRLATAGAIAIVAAFVAGVLTLITKNNWWSYTMAAGFIAALLAHGSLLLPANPPAHGGTPQPQPRHDTEKQHR